MADPTRYDPGALRTFAEKLYRRAAYVAVLYAILGFVVGAPLGAAAMVGLNGVRRFSQIRSREDISELVHSEDKAEELLSLLGHVPLAALAAGGVVGVAGLLFGAQRAGMLKGQAQMALCLAEIEAKRGA